MFYYTMYCNSFRCFIITQRTKNTKYVKGRGKYCNTTEIVLGEYLECTGKVTAEIEKRMSVQAMLI